MRGWRGGAAAEDTDSRQRGADGGVDPDAATMRPHCWMMVVLAVMMSYLSPERALGVPQREGEESGVVGGGGGGGGLVENLSVMLMKGGEGYRDEGVHGSNKKKASELRRVVEQQIFVA